MNVINFEPSECKKLRPYLDSYVNNELLVETNHAVLKHLQECGDCLLALDSRLRVKGALQVAVCKDVAPSELQYRIQRELRKSKAAPFLGWRNWMLVVAVAVIVMIGSWGLFTAIQNNKVAASESAKRQNARVLHVGLGDHVHCAVERKFADEPFTEAEMSAKLGSEFSGLVQLLKDHVPGDYQVVTGHRCTFQQREFVHFILRHQEKMMSLVLTQKNGEAFSTATIGDVLQASGVTLHTGRLENYEVAGFATGDYLAFVVSNLDKSESDKIAADLAPALRQYLAQRES
ncbi:MAG: zf-HC2 domain-containing protein [Acidobacteria bacterium]|nr:zf-HC2 domain-containing protein [Acidobacteriota bacterium]